MIGILSLFSDFKEPFFWFLRTLFTKLNACKYTCTDLAGGEGVGETVQIWTPPPPPHL